MNSCGHDHTTLEVQNVHFSAIFEAIFPWNYINIYFYIFRVLLGWKIFFGWKHPRALFLEEEKIS